SARWRVASSWPAAKSLAAWATASKSSERSSGGSATGRTSTALCEEGVSLAAGASSAPWQAANKLTPTRTIRLRCDFAIIRFVAQGLPIREPASLGGRAENAHKAGMTASQLITLAVLAVVVAALIWDKVRSDVVALAGAAVLLMTGVVRPVEVQSAFASPAIIALASLFVIAYAMELS